MRFVERCAIRIESDTQNAETLQRIASLLPQFRHLLPRRQANLDRPNQLRDIVGMNLLRCGAVETPQNSMQMIGTASRSTLAQALAQFLRALRPGEESFEQSAQVQSGAADHDRQSDRAR